MAIIGKNVIENLTTAMYEDLKIIYREYIQNSADSIDHAVKEKIIEARDARIEINIEANKRYICIKDNGTGIQADKFEKIMSSIADSQKSRESDKGFRGIGRLGGISSCGKLIFKCSAYGELIQSCFIWDAKKVKEILADKDFNPTASELVDTVTSCSTEPAEFEKHFFSVELLDVDKSAEELLVKEQVEDYLEAVAPVTYSTGFYSSGKIKEYAKAHNFHIDTYNIFVNGNQLFKNYTEKLYEPYNNNKSKKAYDELIGLKFEIFKDNHDNVLAWMWYGISNFEKAIPVINKMRGIRLRKDNIQIGDAQTFTSHGFYKESRGAQYFVGEVFAVHPDLIPNARRDYFNLNDTCRLFEEKLRPLFYDRFYQLYHRANASKNAFKRMQEYDDFKKKYHEKEEHGGFISSNEKQKEGKNLETKFKQAQEASRKLDQWKEKYGDDDVLSKVYNSQEEKYKKTVVAEPNDNTGVEYGDNIEGKPNRKKGNPYLSRNLTQYSKKEQKLIGKIYDILHDILPPDLADDTITKVQEKLQKSAGKTK